MSTAPDKPLASDPPAKGPRAAGSFQHRQDLLGVFAQHPVACNLLMTMMIVAGMWGLARLNTQFFPNFALDFISVRTVWTGASAEDVEDGITNPLERELRTLAGVHKMTSTSREGLSFILLEYEEGTDMGVALDQVNETVALVRNLPANAEDTEVARLVRYEPVARLLVTGPGEASDLRSLVQRMERELLERGIAKIDIAGLPSEEIAIQVPSAALLQLGLSTTQVAERITAASRDQPAGTIGRSDVARQLRTLGQRRREIEFEDLPLISAAEGRLVTVGDVATVQRRSRSGQTELSHKGKPAAVLQLQRAESTDTLASARILSEWLEQAQGGLPPGVELEVFDEAWQLVRGRILLLVVNGGGGLLLVVTILFLFLNGRVAWWVALGIPISFMATLGVLYAVGGSINMISLFALIMALGIIVDDAIVVGEDALAHFQAGEHELQAAEGGARRMLGPVMSSSLTTIAAFAPLMLVGGIIGNILFEIPLVIVCVIAASLAESFLVLPGHLRHAFTGLRQAQRGRVRVALEHGFDRFKERLFRPVATWAVRYPWVTVCCAVAALLLCAGLVKGGRVAFTFFPSTESTVLTANVSFVAGTPRNRVTAFLDHLEHQIYAAEAALETDLITVVTVRKGATAGEDGRGGDTGDQFGSLTIELLEPDQREVRNGELIAAWRARIVEPPGLELLTIKERRPGPPGRDVDVRLTGSSAAELKAAALELGAVLSTVPGTNGIEDDMPYGQEQLIYTLRPEARALGLTEESVGAQLRGAFDGALAQIFQSGEDELEVRVVLPDEERNRLASLDTLNIVLPGGGSMPLLSVVDLDTRRGFDILRHKGGRLAVRVSADVDASVNNANEVTDNLSATVLPRIATEYGVEFSFEGRRADQDSTLADMRLGGMVALALIYLVLAWVFASYGWPLVVMAAIPFGLVGAITGHWLMGIDLTILSLFGLFGLSGIVINDSIILVVFYKQLRNNGMRMAEAIVEAACQRLRAVLLTSLTTIGGLLPLLFETSLQAQFLIPMAVSISFGLAFATLLVLLVVPSLLRVHEDLAAWLWGRPVDGPSPGYPFDDPLEPGTTATDAAG
ncbi:MAG: efflux RND transporter permease subunit [Gammaproteobacteria bacterium]